MQASIFCRHTNKACGLFPFLVDCIRDCCISIHNYDCVVSSRLDSTKFCDWDNLLFETSVAQANGCQGAKQ